MEVSGELLRSHGPSGYSFSVCNR